MVTVLVLILFGVAFAAFALLGPAERARACEHGQPGDPKCEHCPLGGEEDGTLDIPDLQRFPERRG